MSNLTRKHLNKLLSLPHVSVSPTGCEIVVNTQDGAAGTGVEWEYCNDDPGAVLRIGPDHHYSYYAGESEPDDNKVTYGELRSLGLLDLLDPDIAEQTPELSDDEEVGLSDFDAVLVDHLVKVAERAGREADAAVADACAEALLAAYPEAAHFLRHSPRGFGNEYALYAVRKGELRKAKTWLFNEVLSEDEPNQWWDVLTPGDVYEILAESFGYATQADRASAQKVEKKTINGWWGEPAE